MPMIEGSALYYDGLSNKQHAVTLRIGATLEIVEGGRMIAGWPFEAAGGRLLEGGLGSAPRAAAAARIAPRLDTRRARRWTPGAGRGARLEGGAFGHAYPARSRRFFGAR